MHHHDSENNSFLFITYLTFFNINSDEMKRFSFFIKQILNVCIVNKKKNY